MFCINLILHIFSNCVYISHKRRTMTILLTRSSTKQHLQSWLVSIIIYHSLNTQISLPECVSNVVITQSSRKWRVHPHPNLGWNSPINANVARACVCRERVRQKRERSLRSVSVHHSHQQQHQLGPYKLSIPTSGISSRESCNQT